jgi:hypothetical protein
MFKETYEIVYRDPETEEERSVVKEFTGNFARTPYEAAEDLAYMLADKGFYEIKRVRSS